MARLPKSFFPVASALAFLALGFGLFCSTGHDDSHITYWAAHTLQKFGQIVNYNGERVEQSSSLVHVVILAILSAVTRVQLPTLGPITSIAAGVVAILLVAKLVRLAAPNAPRGVELLVGTADCFIHWGFGGLETTIVAAASVWVVYECTRYLMEPRGPRLARAGVAMLLYVTSRPESPLVLGCVLGAALAYLGYRRLRFGEPEGSLFAALRAPLALAAVGAVLSLALFAFRKAYFGLYYPNPVYSKVSHVAIIDGIAYVGVSLFPFTLWVLPGVFYGVRHVFRAVREPRAPELAAVLSAAFVFAYLSFVVLVGGDWMKAGRFFAHATPMIAVVTAIGLASRIQTEKRRKIALVALIAMNVAGTVLLAFLWSNGRPIWTTPGLRAKVEARVGDRGFGWFELTNLVHLRDTTMTGEMLDLVKLIREKEPGHKITFMSTQAGMVTYRVAIANYGAVRFVDQCSLVTRYFLTCPAAHELLDTSRFGLTMSFETFFGNEEKLQAACGMARPDIVFSVVPRRDIPVFKENGYTLFYEQKGAIRGELSKERRSADAFRSDQAIAVDTELFKRLGLKKKDRYPWDIR